MIQRFNISIRRAILSSLLFIVVIVLGGAIFQRFLILNLNAPGSGQEISVVSPETGMHSAEELGRRQEQLRVRFFFLDFILFLQLLLAIFLVVYFLERKLILPVRILISFLRRQAGDQSDFSERVHLATGGELDELGVELNRLMAYLEKTTVARDRLLVESAHRQRAEEELELYEKDLEELVESRTFELRKANAQLQTEVRQRQEVEVSLRQNEQKIKQMEDGKSALEVQLRQVQKMEAIGALAGGIAHDFNNILSGLFGYAELVKMDLEPGSSMMADVDEILKAASRARDLVRQLLTFSREKEHPFSPQQVQFVIKEAVRFLRSSIPATLAIEVDIDADCQAVLADPTQIHQLFMNLCTNSYHAMRESGGTLRISLHEEEIGDSVELRKANGRAGKYVVFAVGDTGHGMDQLTLERIFEPYFTTKEKSEGAGLGLSVVHGIVKSHGGFIHVDSAVGVGTVVKIYFPVVGSADNHRLEEEFRPMGGNEKIMIVDDEETIIRMEQRLLERLGYQVKGAFTRSTDALAYFNRHAEEIDLVITDMNMPDIDGADLSRQLLAVRADIPIILCSGFSEAVSEEEAKAIGVREFIMKPVVKRAMAESIHRALHHITKARGV